MTENTKYDEFIELYQKNAKTTDCTDVDHVLFLIFTNEKNL